MEKLTLECPFICMTDIAAAAGGIEEIKKGIKNCEKIEKEK